MFSRNSFFFFRKNSCYILFTVNYTYFKYSCKFAVIPYFALVCILQEEKNESKILNIHEKH